MKKIIFSLLVLSLIGLCFSTNLHAQSSEQDLDQRELTKQFIGLWTNEIEGDSTVLWEVIPEGMGYIIKARLQAKGETYMSVNGLMGFQARDQIFVEYLMLPNGGIIRDVAKFVSDTKAKYDRYRPQNPNHVSEKIEVNFITPDKYKVTYKKRGMKETWDDAVVTERTYIRIKK